MADVAYKIPKTLEKKTRTDKTVEVRKKPYFKTIARGISIGYRRNQGAGSWVVRGTDGRGKLWTKVFATADDIEPANGVTVMSFTQAKERAPILARGSSDSSSTSDGNKPITVERAIDAYESDLIARGQSRYNATMVRKHIKGTAIYGMPVVMLKQQVIADIRNGLVASGLVEPSSVDRIGKVFKAALNLAADRDQRIKNSREWTKGWAMLANSSVANNIIIPEDRVNAIISKAYEVDHKLGVTFHTQAATGTGYKQIKALRVADLQDDNLDNGTPAPRLMVPARRKGKNPKLTYEPFPITPQLAKGLRAMAAGRSASAPLFDKIFDKLEQHFYQIAALVGGVDEDASPQSFRHTSITRMLMAGKPVTLVAKLHHTSVAKIESNYAAFISYHGDALIRSTLQEFDIPTT
jgi:hypothetical protein